MEGKGWGDFFSFWKRRTRAPESGATPGGGRRLCHVTHWRRIREWTGQSERGGSEWNRLEEGAVEVFIDEFSWIFLYISHILFRYILQKTVSLFTENIFLILKFKPLTKWITWLIVFSWMFLKLNCHARKSLANFFLDKWSILF